MDVPPMISSLRQRELTPVAAGERIETLDVLRGVAVFGILVVNMAAFGFPADQVMMGQGFGDSRADAVADWIVWFLAQGKFYPVFAFLFGLGAALQMERAECRGADFAGRFCRRLLVLLGIGLAHALLLWEGDILVWYALLGFLLLAFRKRKPRTLLIWAGGCLLIPAAGIAILWALLAGVSLIPEIGQLIERELIQEAAAARFETEETIRVFAQGSLAEIFTARVRNLMLMWLVGVFFSPTVLALFLLGLYAGRRRIFWSIGTHRGLIRRVLVWGLAVGLPGNLIYAIGLGLGDPSDVRFLWLLSMAVVVIAGPALGLAYAAAITLLVQREVWRGCLRCLAAVGRMALSNYLLQSLVCTTIFYSYGLGWYGSVGRAGGLGLAMLIFAFQVAASFWWLNRFQFGPMEWLWRSLTYGGQPLRRR